MFDTWGGQSDFDYEGDLQQGTTIIYGQGRRQVVTSQQYRLLLTEFAGQTIPVAPARTDVEAGSLEGWLNQNVTRTAIASYVAPILILEGAAIRVEGGIQFNR